MKTRNTLSLTAAVLSNQTDREIVDGCFVVTDQGGQVLAVESTEQEADAQADAIERDFDKECIVSLVIDESL